MKITSVTYRTNVSLPGYRTKHVEASATVEKGENPRKVLHALARFVHRELGIPFEASRSTSVLRNVGDEGSLTTGRRVAY